MPRSDDRGQGFGTRAIRAASRPRPVLQSPQAMPIYQSATFSAEDSAELGDILSDRRTGYAYAPHRQPNVRRDGSGHRRARERRGGLRARIGYGRHPRRGGIASQRR